VGDPAYQFAPELARRIHWNSNTDTPLPPDEPAGQNPPDGATLNYYLKSAPSSPVTLEIVDSAGKIIRRYSSADPVPQPDPQLPVPEYWIRPYQALSAAPGLHRFLWDMHYAPVPGVKPEYPIAAIAHDTAAVPTSPWAMPGKYRVVLTVDGTKYMQPLTLEMDPRVKTSMADLQKQLDLSNQVYENLKLVQPILGKAAAAKTQLKTMREKATGAQATKLDDAIKELTAVEGGGRRRRRARQEENLSNVQSQLLQILTALQEVDAAPTAQVAEAVPKLDQQTRAVIQQWNELLKGDLEPLGVK
jgi:hypothetical protein